MQLSLHRHFVLPACGAALAAVLSSTVFAAELGEVAVRSHVGQQLSADIELVMLTPEDAAGVQVKLAAPNVYQGANTRIHPALSSLRMTVVKRDNRQFLHLTTIQPVDAEILHLFLELGTGSRASVRLATLWLTPEPAPAPKPAPLRPPPESASAVADMMAADAVLAAQAGQTAPSAQGTDARAAALRAAKMRAAAQNAIAAKDPAGAAKADRAAGGEQGASASAGPASRSAASAPVLPGPAAVPIKLTPEARMKQGQPGGAKASCTPGQSGDDAQQCLALDQTNAELKTKLVDLEGKVKQLQAALGQGGAAAAAVPGAAAAHPSAGSAAATAASAPASQAAAPGSASAPVAPASAASAASPADAVAKATAKKKAAGINTTTLIAGGGLLLALVLGLLVYYIRKKKFQFSTAPLKVWQGWRKDKKPAEAAAPVPAEPILGNE